MGLDGYVQGRYRFIGDDQFGIQGQGAGNADALPLPAAELVGVAIDLIGAKADATAIKQAAIAKGMVTLKEEGAAKVLQGQTTLEEVMRITQQEIDV